MLRQLGRMSVGVATLLTSDERARIRKLRCEGFELPRKRSSMRAARALLSSEFDPMPVEDECAPRTAVFGRAMRYWAVSLASAGWISLFSAPAKRRRFCTARYRGHGCRVPDS